MPDKPSWTPDVAVIGLGETGSETVERIATKTSTEFHSISDKMEAESVAKDVEDMGFCFFTSHLDEPGVVEYAETILRAVQCHTTFLVEGRTTQTSVVVEETSFLIKATLGEYTRDYLASTIADLFEAMLPPTVEKLGHGDITVTTSNRVGKLYIETRDGTQHDLTPDIQFDPDSVLYFNCTSDRVPRKQVERRAVLADEEYDVDVDFLWDNRVHPRYQDHGHFKRIVTVETSPETREQLLQK